MEMYFFALKQKRVWEVCQVDSEQHDEENSAMVNNVNLTKPTANTSTCVDISLFRFTSGSEQIKVYDIQIYLAKTTCLK